LIFALLAGFLLMLSLVMVPNIQGLLIFSLQLSDRLLMGVVAIILAVICYTLIIVNSINLLLFITWRHEIVLKTISVMSIIFMVHFTYRLLAKPPAGLSIVGLKMDNIKRIAFITIIVGLFNPFTILEVCGVIGVFSINYIDIYQQNMFIFGAILALLFWFTSLGFDYRLLIYSSTKKYQSKFSALIMSIEIILLIIKLIK
jgi:arginine exporter protein ArgO